MARVICYRDGDQTLEGYFTCPAAAIGLPGILIAPTWLNVDDGLRRRADRLAALGYAAFVLDVFGAGARPGPPQRPRDVIMPFMRDRWMYRRRLLAGMETLRRQPECDEDRIAAIGFCFGGCGVLELARCGAPLRGVVSLHGALDSPLPARPGAITAKVLVLHGDADAVVPFDCVTAFREEMRAASADWQINLYADAKHGFTGEGSAGDETPEARLHARTERRAWQATLEFLREALG